MLDVGDYVEVFGDYHPSEDPFVLTWKIYHYIRKVKQPTVKADVNLDGIVDYRDLAILVSKYGSRRGDADYTSTVDLNSDGVIDYRDLALLVAQYGTRY